MAQVKLNPILDELRGQLGEVVFKRYGHKTVISRKPDMSKVKPSEAQLARRAQFKAATEYSKQALADPALKAVYAAAAARLNKPLNSVMIADFLNAPTVEQVDASGYRGQVGDEIVVVAGDDFGVAAVELEIIAEGGEVVESGPAVESPAGGGRWLYEASTTIQTARVQIRVTAVDRPGHRAVQTVLRVV